MPQPDRSRARRFVWSADDFVVTKPGAKPAEPDKPTEPDKPGAKQAGDADPFARGFRALARPARLAHDEAIARGLRKIAMDAALARGWRAFALDAWEESKHPRGQPGNAGEFGPGGGGKAPAGPAGGGKPAASAEPSAKSEASPGPAQPDRSYKPIASPLYEAATKDFPKDEAGRNKLASAVAERLGATELVAKANAANAAGKPTSGTPENGGFKNADETWTPEREAKHEEILDELFSPERIAAAAPKLGEKPVLSIFGGRGGSGKSFLSQKDKGGPVDAANTIVLDADYFKEHLPGYNGTNAALYHDESSYLLERAVDRALDHGVNTALDVTLKSPGKAEGYIKRFKPAGYDVDGYYMFASPQTATENALKRYKGGMEKKGVGRFVPPEIVMGNTTNEDNFDRAVPFLRNWAIYDNDKRLPTGPRLVAKSGGDK